MDRETLRLCPYYIDSGKCSDRDCNKLHYAVVDTNFADSLYYNGTIRSVIDDPNSNLLTICVRYIIKGYCIRRDCEKLHIARQDLKNFKVTKDEILDKKYKRESKYVERFEYEKLTEKYKKLKERIKVLENKLNNS